METATPAINGLEQAAFILLCVSDARAKNPTPTAIAAHGDALVAFVTFEANYLGIDKEYVGAHDRARELMKGL